MRILVLFLTYLMIVTEVFSQQLELVNPGYYRKDTTYVMNGYSYHCEGNTGNITLYNAGYQNKWVTKKQVYKDTGKSFDFGFGDIKKYNPIIDDLSMNQKVLNIIDNAFTKEFVENLKGDELLNVVMYLNSGTGKVEEVSFWFIDIDGYASLPISTYRNIELQLIDEISYTPSAIGKQLNYIMLSLMRKPLGKSSSGAVPKPME